MFKNHPSVQAALSSRNKSLSKFWLIDPAVRYQPEITFIGRKVLIVDAEDTFTEMLSQQLSAIGLQVTLRKFDHPDLFTNHWDLFLMGPGPGDPRDLGDNRIARMRSGIIALLTKNYPFLAVCLSHQILCVELGLNILRKTSPNQGVQHEIDFFGSSQLVGFYNTYAASCSPSMSRLLEEKHITVCLDSITDEVHALRGPHFASVQFHPESILTQNGIDIITSSIKWILKYENNDSLLES